MENRPVKKYWLTNSGLIDKKTGICLGFPSDIQKTLREGSAEVKEGNCRTVYCDGHLVERMWNYGD